MRAKLKTAVAFTALLSASGLATEPALAAAAMHGSGGHFGGGGFGHGGGHAGVGHFNGRAGAFRGWHGGWRGGWGGRGGWGWRGGWRGWGWGWGPGFYWGGYPWFWGGLGFATGVALAYPYYNDDYSSGDYGPPPPEAGTQPPQAGADANYGCTAWRWDASQNKYVQVRSACN